MIRQLQPDILINDRLPEQGDFVTPEQFALPQSRPGLSEISLTMNHSQSDDTDSNYKPAREIVHTLCETASGEGNSLLNLSPMGNSQISLAQTVLLHIVAEWMSRYGESIFNTQPGLEP